MKKKKILLGLGAFALLGFTLSSCNNAKVYEVTFYDGDKELVKELVTSGYNAEVPLSPTSEGKVFNGWFADSSLTEAFDFGSIIEGNTKIYAAWVNEYAVTFKDGDSTLSTQNVVSGYNAKVPTQPTKDGKVFAGWYSDSAYTKEFNFGDVIKSNTVVYAKWIDSSSGEGTDGTQDDVKVTFTVTFRELDGTIIDTVTVEEGKKVTNVPDALFIYGKKFIGWTSNNADFDLNTAISSNVDLVAKYKDIDVDPVQLTVAQGAQESVYAEFKALPGVTDYNAYILNTNSNQWIKLDKQLIRLYKGETENYYRVDVLGLKAGNYKIRIAGVVNNEEIGDTEAISSSLSVTSYDRSGFAFVANEKNSTGDASGAYNADGTLKAGARVIYVSSANAKTISLEMQVDSKGKIEQRTGLQNIISAYEKGCEARPLAVRVLGKLSKEDLDEIGSSAEGLQIKGKADGQNMNLTIEGVGYDAFIYGFGFLIRNCSNVEIRNLGFATLLDDDISFDTGNYNVWTHNCDFYYGKKGSGDHIKGDGALDVKGTMYATLSYNHFWDTGKTTLNSNGDSVDHVTYHHNWYDHSDSRHPRVRMSTEVHVYNNYYDGVSKYGIGAAKGGTSIFSECNYFRNCKNPIMSSMQGTDVYAGTNTYSLDNATFSKEDGGIIKSYGDVMTGNYTFIPYGCTSYVAKGVEVPFELGNIKDVSTPMTSTIQFDAYVAKTRNEVVPESVVSYKGGTKYSNFDTKSTMYTYTVQTAEETKETVIQYAGRLQGGDLKWTFDNATEDSNYGLIDGLRSAIDNYSSKMISVLGIETSGGNGSGSTTPDTPSTPTQNAYQNVISLIDALPEATAVTQAYASQINAAKTAFEALSSEDKALVTNKAKLDACVAALEALPAPSSFTLDFKTLTVETGKDNVTLYDKDSLLITATKVASQDDNGIKFNEKKSFTIKNNKDSSINLAVSVVANKDTTKTISYNDTTLELSKKVKTLDFVLAAGQSITISTATGGIYLQTIVVS